MLTGRRKEAPKNIYLGAVIHLYFGADLISVQAFFNLN